MTLHAAMHLLGWISLAAMYGIATLIFADAWRQRRRIWSTLLGRNLPPAASVTRPPSRRPSAPAIEARSALTGEGR